MIYSQNYEKNPVKPAPRGIINSHCPKILLMLGLDAPVHPVDFLSDAKTGGYGGSLQSEFGDLKTKMQAKMVMFMFVAHNSKSFKLYS